MNRSNSEKYFSQAQKVMPGGVSSPVRAFGSVGGSPLFIDRAEGAYVWDVDDQKYIDYVGSWGPAILGHAHVGVLEKVVEAAHKGLSFGAPTIGETHLAEKIIGALPSVEMLRFVSSGTEACMSAIRLARGFTGREKILKFTGNYHGHGDMLLVKAGSGVATFGLPDSPGVPAGAANNTLVSRYNDLEAVKEVFESNKNEIAAVIIEPIVGNSGFIRAADDFLEKLREITLQHGTLLIFDEVMTGFRVAWGGVQGIKKIKPDLTTLGKVIGGGMPLAAYGGRRDIMSQVAPVGPVYQAGTLSGNPVAVASGQATLDLLGEPGIYEGLAEKTAFLLSGFKGLAAKYRIPFICDSEGGMFGFFFSEQPIRCFEDAQLLDPELFKQFHGGMLAEGVYLAPSLYEAGFMSLGHTDSDVERTLKAAENVFSKL